MNKYLLLCITLFLFACNRQSEVSREENEIYRCPPSVVLQPCNSFTEKEALTLIPKLKEFIKQYSGVELDFEVLPPKKLSKTFLNAAKTRYRADKIINSMSDKATSQYVIVNLIHDDISIPYKGRDDWGILGLALQPKYVCVASDHRLRNKKRDYWKVIVHEFIHTYHRYPHCPKDNPNCIMQDCKGHADFINKSRLCSYCDSLLNI